YLARLPDRLAWIHGHDVLAEGRPPCTSASPARGRRRAGAGLPQPEGDIVTSGRLPGCPGTGRRGGTAARRAGFGPWGWPGAPAGVGTGRTEVSPALRSRWHDAASSSGVPP